MRRLLILVVLGLALLINPSEAHHKPGHDRGPGGLTATVFAEPDRAPAGVVVVIRGCGYSTDVAGSAEIEHGTTLEKTGVWVLTSGCDEGGRIAFPFKTTEANTYTVRVFQKQKNKKVALVAQGTFEVMP